MFKYPAPRTPTVFAVAAAMAITAAFGAKTNAAVYTTAGTPITLSTLTSPGNSIDLGGLTFYNFAVTNATGDMPSPSDVTVTPEFITVSGQTTVGFELSGGFLDTGFSSGASDFLLKYEVQSDSGQAIISDAHIQGNLSVTGTGLGTVTDTWLPDVTGESMTISDVSGGTPLLAASYDFTSPFSHLYAQKDILLFVPNNSASVASLSFVDQTYSTLVSGGSVPEPASLGILALGATALLARRRR